MAEPISFATLTDLWQEYEVMPRELAFRATSRAEWAAWRERFTARLAEVLGGFPTVKAPVEPVMLDGYDTPDYRVEKVALQSLGEGMIPCHVLTPRHSSPPYRAVIALHGHGSGGAAHLLGLPRSETTRQEELAHIAIHNYDYAHQLAQAGFLVFVPEQRGFGERMEPHPGMIGGNGLWQSSCRALAYNALLLGKTLQGLRVWDVMRTLDYITSRADVTQGVGCVGLSGGGTTTLYAAALDPRITVAVVSGAFGTFRSSIMSTIHCDCNYVPGILQVAEMADIAALIAPRALLVENGTDDPIFPVDATERALDEVARVYDLMGVPERLARDIFVGGHQFSGRLAFDWLAHWLQA